MSHLFFGLGFGNWERSFTQLTNPLLSGIAPVYMHSDPLQLLVEGGVIGFFPLACIAILIGVRSVKVLFSSERSDALKVLGLSVALLSFTIASLFDFPFRIPGVAAYSAVYLALLTHVIDSTESQVLGDID